MRVERLAEEKAKKKVATKRQEELELRRKQEEAARKKKLQQAVSSFCQLHKLLLTSLPFNLFFKFFCKVTLLNIHFSVIILYNQ